MKKIIACIILLGILLSPPFSGAESKAPAGEMHLNGSITFNFIDVDIPIVTKFVSEITGKNFIFDEKLHGKVTIIAPSKLKTEDAYRLFTSVLELKGFTVVPSGTDTYKIIPVTDVKGKGIRFSEFEKKIVNEEYIARLIKLTHLSSSEAISFLKPVISKDGYISEFSPGNILLIMDSGPNLRNILSIIKNIDRPSTVDLPEIIYLKYADAESVAGILSETSQQPSIKRKGSKTTTPKKTKVITDTRLNALILFGTGREKDSMKRLISMLDIPSPEAQGGINVYFLENADAAELADVLNSIVNNSKSKRKSSKTKNGKDTLGQPRNIVITPDVATNSIIIEASPADYRNIVEVIRKLDKRRRQVFVEAMIVEASIDGLQALGAKWRAVARNDSEPVFVGGFGEVSTSDMMSIVYGMSGVSVGGLSNFFDIEYTTLDESGDIVTSSISIPGYSALFNLNEFRGIVNILSTPQILTSDNEEAEIIVGENVPFITKRESDPSRTVSVFSNVERHDVGITLRITPQITEGDYIKLDIYQEISSLKQESNPEILISVGPTTTKRSTKTSIVIKDNQNVVISGLMQEREEETITKVPLLGDIPLLGWLFKDKGKSHEKINLLVFLTPHIVRNAEHLREITEKKKFEIENSSIDINGEVPPRSNPGLLVRFRNDMEREQAENYIRDAGSEVIREYETINLFLVKIPDSKTQHLLIERLEALPEVLYVEPDYFKRTLFK